VCPGTTLALAPAMSHLPVSACSQSLAVALQVKRSTPTLPSWLLYRTTSRPTSEPKRGGLVGLIPAEELGFGCCRSLAKVMQRARGPSSGHQAQAQNFAHHSRCHVKSTRVTRRLMHCGFSAVLKAATQKQAAHSGRPTRCCDSAAYRACWTLLLSFCNTH
jgi:hypothetical protein